MKQNNKSRFDSVLNTSKNLFVKNTLYFQAGYKRIVYAGLLAPWFVYLIGCGGEVLTTVHSNSPAEPLNLAVSSPKRIATGANNHFVIREGKVMGWGNNAMRKTQPPTLDEPIIGISAGLNHTVALGETGAVYTWGGSQDLQAPDDVMGAVQVVAGSNSTLVLLQDGTVKVWGDEQRTVSSVNDIVAIDSGYEHYLALHEDGRIAQWSKYDDVNSMVPKSLTDQFGAEQIAAGAHHNLALLANGEVKAWGQNDFGQCDVPEFGEDVIAIEATRQSSLALLASGRVEVWGASIPALNRLTGVVGIEANYDQVLVTLSNGEVRVIQEAIPLNLSALTDVDQVKGNMVKHTNGEVEPIIGDFQVALSDLQGDWIAGAKLDFDDAFNFPVSQSFGIWGGAPPDPDSELPSDIDYRLNRGYPNLVLDNAGTGDYWASGTDFSDEVPLMTGDIEQVSCAPNYCLALVGGEVVAWGTDELVSKVASSQSSSTLFKAIGATRFRAFGVTESGGVVVWANDGATTPPMMESLTQVEAMGVSYSEAAFVLEDGSVWVWNYLDSAPHIVPALSDANNQPVMAIPARARGVTLLTTQGEVIQLGSDWSPLGAAPQASSPITDIDALGWFSGVLTALDTEGNLRIWGEYFIPEGLVNHLSAPGI